MKPGRLSFTVVALSLLLTPAVALSPPALAQSLDLPRLSPRAEVTQRVGVSTITLDFGRPGVKGRKIWGEGGLVPYNDGDPLPWRTGADEPTTLTLSHDAEIGGQPIAAGTYGLMTIPDEEEWTLIFTTNTSNSFAYDPEEDVLRLTVAVESAPFQERLLFALEDLDQAERAEVALRWENKKVSFEVSFDLAEIVLTEARELLARQPEAWVPYFQAADFSREHGGDLEEALAWIEESLRRERNQANLTAKARLLEALGRDEEATAVRAQIEPYTRDGWQRVGDIFERMAIVPGSWVADVGAGGGFLTTRLAAAVGEHGQVFAVEIDELALRRLDSLLDEEGIANVTVVHGGAANPRLPPAALDAVVIVNAYHEMPKYETMLERLYAALEPGGRLVLVEPMSESSRGKDRSEQVRNHDLEIGLAQAEIEAAGFEVLEAIDPFVEMPGGGTEWILVGAKPAGD